MPFPQLEHYKSRDPEVATLLSELELRLDEVLRRPPHELAAFYASPSHDINPRWIATELKTTAARAQALLYMCFESGILRPRYDVYCPENHNYIGSFSSPDQLPFTIECPHHDELTEHDKDTYAVSLLYEFSPPVLTRALTMAG